VSSLLYNHNEILPHLRPKEMEPADLGLKYLKLWATKTFAPLSWFLSGIL
jgi:hypothetical protein